jgi:hypothetical protein
MPMATESYRQPDAPNFSEILTQKIRKGNLENAMYVQKAMIETVRMIEQKGGIRTELLPEMLKIDFGDPRVKIKTYTEGV